MNEDLIVSMCLVFLMQFVCLIVQFTQKVNNYLNLH